MCNFAVILLPIANCEPPEITYNAHCGNTSTENLITLWNSRLSGKNARNHIEDLSQF